MVRPKSCFYMNDKKNKAKEQKNEIINPLRRPHRRSGAVFEIFP